MPSACACGSETYSWNRCDECRLTLLEAAGSTAAGILANSVMNLNFALEKGFTIRLDEIACSEFSVLKILHQEQTEYDREKDPKQP